MFAVAGTGEDSAFAPGDNHWHGAVPATAITHIAIQEKLNGKVVNWIEHMSGEQYRK